MGRGFGYGARVRWSTQGDLEPWKEAKKRVEKGSDKSKERGRW